MSGDRKRRDARRMGAFLSALRDKRDRQDGARDGAAESRVGAAAPGQPRWQGGPRRARTDAASARHDPDPAPSPENAAPTAGAPGGASGERLIDASVQHVPPVRVAAASAPGAGAAQIDTPAAEDSPDAGVSPDAGASPNAENGSDAASSATKTVGAQAARAASIAARDEAALRDRTQSLWNDAAARYADRVGRAAAQFGPRILELTGSRPGEALLDIACGPGALAGAADAFGIAATGIDFAPAMVAAARARFPRAEFRIGDAEALDVPAGAFEAVVSTFGLTQFAAPARGLREAHRALRPGGRLILAHWAGPDRNPLLRAVEAALAAIAPDAAPRAAAIDFAVPEAAEQALRTAGFQSMAQEQAEATLTLTGADLLDAAQMLDPAVAFRIGSLTQADQAAVADATAAALSDYRNGDRYDLPAPALLYVAAKPAHEAARAESRAAETGADAEAGAEARTETKPPAPAPEPAAATAPDPAAQPVIAVSPPDHGAPQDGLSPPEAAASSENGARPAAPATPPQPVDRLWASAARRNGLGERPAPLPRNDDAGAASPAPSAPEPAPARSFPDAASWKARSRRRPGAQPAPGPAKTESAAPAARRSEPPAQDQATRDQTARDKTDQDQTARADGAAARPKRKPAFGLLRRILDRSDGESGRND